MGFGFTKTTTSVTTTPKVTGPAWNWNPSSYYGYWAEIGRYPDPEEGICNDVCLLVSPSASGPSDFHILRFCACHLTNDKICGKPEQFEARVTKDPKIYDIFPLKSNQSSGQMRIVWTNYQISLVSSNNRLWIYQMSDKNYTQGQLKQGSLPGLPLMSSQNLENIRSKVIANGFDPNKVILSGAAIYALSQGPQKIFTGTLLQPACGSNQAKRYSINEPCQGETIKEVSVSQTKKF